MRYFDCYLVYLSSWLLLAWQPSGEEGRSSSVAVCSFSGASAVSVIGAIGWRHADVVQGRRAGRSSQAQI